MPVNQTQADQRVPPAPGARSRLGSGTWGRLLGRTLGWLLDRLTSSHPNRGVVFGEIVALPLLAVALGWYFNPTDPLWLQAEFPWVWFAPALLALRYGPLAGLGGAVVLLLAWIGFNFGQDVPFPDLPFLGGLILVMLCGEFSSLWIARTRQAESARTYLEQQLEYLTHQHYLLRLSHDRLEQDLISRPMAMRDALKTLRGVGSTDQDPGADGLSLLRLLAQFCQLETASIHTLDSGQLRQPALASIGQPRPLAPDDPLLQQALLQNRLCHVSQALGKKQQPSRYLIAAPLTSFDGATHGLLLVEKIPFFSLQEETLQTINLLLSYFIDGMVRQTLAQPILAELPDCPPRFACEIQRLWHLKQASGVNTSVVAFEIRPRPGQNDIAEQIQRQKRLLDESWLTSGPQQQLLALLLPLTDAGGAELYLARMENWAQQRSGKTLAECGVFSHVLPLGPEPAVAVLRQLKKLADVQLQAG
ncbi:PelD GGDEF domain-containing protein [Hydrogenophaga sp.]|uniref:PelD GGDEF domain-containing protein n=1 Tax=Hydrogenophaga sp. TaxID=1904254 RepID=UPI001988914D|nr:PelD GGDEF domain-containing protein [Hydrogenophaga sp.]MBD3894152.1 hypothetical protein [Hydrogenophaga sp.]